MNRSWSLLLALALLPAGMAFADNTDIAGELRVRMPRVAKAGGNVVVLATVTNTGGAVLEGVRIQALGRMFGGTADDTAAGTLRPGQSKTFKIKTTAPGAGEYTSIFNLVGNERQLDKVSLATKVGGVEKDPENKEPGSAAADYDSGGGGASVGKSSKSTGLGDSFVVRSLAPGGGIGTGATAPAEVPRNGGNGRLVVSGTKEGDTYIPGYEINAGVVSGNPMVGEGDKVENLSGPGGK